MLVNATPPNSRCNPPASGLAVASSSLDISGVIRRTLGELHLCDCCSVVLGDRAVDQGAVGREGALDEVELLD